MNRFVARILLVLGRLAKADLASRWRLVVHNPPPWEKGKRKLREWWHSILIDYGKYPCSAFFLALPSDGDATNYFINYQQDIELLSGDNCLVIFVSDTEVRSKNINVKYHSELETLAIEKSKETQQKISSNDEIIWEEVLFNHVKNGHALQIAKHFNIDFDNLPCLLLFEHMNSTHNLLLISLKELDTFEISEKMREIFSHINHSITLNKNPLEALEAYLDQQKVKEKKHKLVHKLISFADKTYEMAITSVIFANSSSP